MLHVIVLSNKLNLHKKLCMHMKFELSIFISISTQYMLSEALFIACWNNQNNTAFVTTKIKILYP